MQDDHSEAYRITVLVENTVRRPGLLAEHGLALWIETPRGTVLFDTGQGWALHHNADKLGIRLDSASAIVLSHGHYDHGGALSRLLCENQGARVFLHPDAGRVRYAHHAGQTPRANGLSAATLRVLDENSHRICWCDQPQEVIPGVHVTGAIPRRAHDEKINRTLFQDHAAQMPDDVPDDLAAWLMTRQGVVVLLGCAHAGVVNTLEHVARECGVQRFLGVLGGMHLEDAGMPSLHAVIGTLQQYQVETIAPNHCTGSLAIQALTRVFGTSVARFNVGDCLLWE